MTDPLAAFVEKHVPNPPGVVPEEHPPAPALPFSWRGRIIAFDQALARTGWVDVMVGSCWAEALGVGLIQTESPHKGHEANLRRALQLAKEVRSVINPVRHGLGSKESLMIVHEIPPVGRVMRPESSLLAALAIRQVAAGMGYPVRMVGAQKAKSLLAGKRDASKSDVRKGVLDVLPELGDMKPRNSDTFDAAALAIVAAQEFSNQEVQENP